MRFYTYDQNGKITKILFGRREDAVQQIRDGELLGEGVADDLADYVVGGVLTPRPAITILTTEMPADGEKRLIAADIPAPTFLRIDSDRPVEILKGELFWVPVEPGRWRVRLEPPFPWREHDFQVVVHGAQVD